MGIQPVGAEVLINGDEVIKRTPYFRVFGSPCAEE